MAFIRNTLIAVFGISVGLACGPEPDLELSSGQTIPRGLVEAVEAGEAPRAVVLVGEPGPMGWAQADALDRSPLVRKSARFHALTEEVARSLTETDLTGVRRFEHLPMMVVDVEDVGTLYRLAGAPNVIGVYEDEVFRPSLTNSLNLIGQPTAAAAGATGAGATVAVLDTGTDYTRAAFGSCSAPGESGCKVVHAQDFAPSDGVRDDNGHGTNVSGIVLGVAPDALVADLDVFRSDGLAYSSDIISAIDWIIANQQTHNIVAMNLSLGGGSFDAACPTSVFAVPFANARAAGVLPVVASGNDGFTNAVASPACVPTGVSVGATYATSYFGINWANCTDMNINPDEVTCFSNSSSTLTMLAPGALITAAGLTQGGTSQAAPHVAGAVAVLKQAHPSETIEDSLSRMLDNGVAITDPRNGLIRPRLDLNAALNAVVADTTAPSGTVVIEGNAAATRTSTVSLTLSASDNVAVTEVCLSSQSGCSEWLPYATSRSWVLSGGDGVSNVYALFRDAAGNTSPEASDSILLDTVAPTAGVLEVTASGGTHTLSWSGATDDGSGIASYTVVHAAGSPPNDCLTTTPIYSGTAQSFAYGSPSGQTDGYRVCAVDAAGNVSPGAFFTYVADANSGAPEGTVLVEDGTGWVRSTSVRMDFTVTDPDGVAAMCISNTSSCTAWRGFSARHYHQLASAEGTQTIYVWFRDTLGNESPTPVATAVQVDSTAPVDGTATSVGQDNAVEVSWSGFADTESGITGYRVVTYRQSYAPPTCEHGTVVFEGPGVSAVDSGATNGSRIAYRVCARNAAGLSSAGTTTLAIPRAESDAPTGVIQVDEGTGWVRSTSVLLSFTVTDASGVAAMCISNTETCTAWRGYTAQHHHQLASDQGPQTIYVWFRDTLGNESSQPVTAVVEVDSTAPLGGAVTSVGRNASVFLSWSGFTDIESGVTSYRVVTYGTVSPPPSCQHGTAVYEGSETSFLHEGIPNNVTHGYRVCAVNPAGGVSTGMTTSATPRLENNAPSGTVQVESGTGWVKSDFVRLDFTVSDPSGVAAMCISNTDTCTTWRGFAAYHHHRLASTVGPQTIYVWFRDSIGNASVNPITTVVQVDGTIPTDGTLTGTGQNGAAALSWSGFADPESGVNNYRVVTYGQQWPPPTCRHGSVVYEGASTSHLDTSLTNGSRYAYRVCAQNQAGLWSSGVTTLVAPRLEVEAPTGTVQVEGGTGWSDSTLVQLDFTVSDSSGVAAMCVSNTDTCTAWRGYSARHYHRLASSVGTQTIYVWFRDTLGNESDAPVTAVANVDASAPSEGTVTAAGQDGSVAVSWSGFADAESGIANYRVVTYRQAWAPPTCRHGILVYEGTDTSVVDASLSNGTRYAYRVCAQNQAGVWSNGVTDLATPRAENDAPVGTVQVEDGTGWVASTRVRLDFSVTDASGVAAVCVSNTSTCTAWRGFTATHYHELAGSVGAQAIYVWFRDGLGNESASPVTTSVQVDSTAPTDGTAMATGQDQAIDLSWSGFSEAESSVAAYRVVTYRLRVAPPTCQHGTVVYEGTDTTARDATLTNGELYGYRICAKNPAGVWSAGVEASAVPAAN